MIRRTEMEGDGGEVQCGTAMEQGIARVIDANLNRAREAARVMEDYARFVLDDRAGCEVLKRFRHDLADCVQRIPTPELLASRDTPGDVGTNVSAPSERRRADAREVFIAAARRLAEALRTVEEYAKTFDADLSAAIESLRYRAYDLEQRLLMRGQRSARFADVGLYVIITASVCRGDWLETARKAIAGGAGCIQLREKSLADGELLVRARQLGRLCCKSGALFIVNDRPDVAVLSDADGVHLGQTDMPPADARRIVGPGRLIGLSTHTPQQFQGAVERGPDYISVGPMFESATKPQPHVPGPALLARAVRETTIPIVPVGGITPDNLDTLKRAGARRVCVCSAVIAADDVQAAAGSFARPKREEDETADEPGEHN